MAKKKLLKNTKDIPEWLASVTPFSKGLAFILFVFLPILSFIFGVWYGEINAYTNINNVETVEKPNAVLPLDEDDDSKTELACTLDAQVCPDGSYVGRVPPKCDFQICPGVDSMEPKN